MKYHTTVRMSSIQGNTDNGKCCQEYVETGTIGYWWKDGPIAKPPWKRVERFTEINKNRTIVSQLFYLWADSRKNLEQGLKEMSVTLGSQQLLTEVNETNPFPWTQSRSPGCGDTISNPRTWGLRQESMNLRIAQLLLGLSTQSKPDQIKNREAKRIFISWQMDQQDGLCIHGVLLSL